MEPLIIIDITFNDGTCKRHIKAHSIEFIPDNHWQLKIYITQDDVFKNNPILYWGVEKIEVIGFIDESEVK